MFKKLRERFLAALETQSLFDPSTIDDPIAMRTGWGPTRRGGSNFKTHRIEVVSNTRIKFKASVGMLLFSGVFAGTGLLLLGMGGLFQFSEGIKEEMQEGTYIFMLIGGIFALVGGLMYYYSTPPIVIDKEANVFWKGRKDTRRNVPGPRVKHLIPLEEIHAIQLIPEHVSGDSSYYSYELNLVLKDASRINVIDHGHLKSVRADAATVADFLGVPLWDASMG